MNTVFLLVLLTLGDAGQTKASFVNTDSYSACKSKSMMLATVLSTTGVEIIENKCVESSLKFSEFSHQQEGSVEQYAYLVQLSGDGDFDLQSIKQNEDCVEIKNKIPENNVMTYCVTSTQKIL